MKITEFNKELEKRTGIGRYAQFINAILILVVAAQAVALANADRTHRETLIPPTINKTFWIEDEKVSPEYLEQMGSFLMQLALNRTPTNAVYQVDELLKYVAPNSYPELRRQLQSDAVRQKEDNITMVFFPRHVTVDSDKQAVLFEGVTKKWIGDKIVGDDLKKYIIKFGFKGRVFLEDISDVTAEKDPWNA